MAKDMAKDMARRVTSTAKVKAKDMAKDMTKEKVKAKAKQALARAILEPSKEIATTAGFMATERQPAHSHAKAAVITWCRISTAIQQITM